MAIALARHGITWIFIALAAATASLMLLPDPSTALLAGEGGVIERGTALLFIAAAACFGMVAWRQRGWLRAHAIFWALLAFVCAGEETSWLQHELGFETPEAVAAVNAQGEFNLHNLVGLQGGRILGGGSSAGEAPWLGLLGSQNLFQLGFVIFFLVVPLLAILPWARRLAARLEFPYPGVRMVATIWLPIIAAVGVTLASSGAMRSLAAETRELHYSAAFLLFAACWLVASRQGSFRTGS